MNKYGYPHAPPLHLSASQLCAKLPQLTNDPNHGFDQPDNVFSARVLVLLLQECTQTAVERWKEREKW